MASRKKVRSVMADKRRANSGFPNHEKYVTLPDDWTPTAIGTKVVKCECGAERWYGYGPCRTCGELLPDFRDTCMPDIGHHVTPHRNCILR